MAATRKPEHRRGPPERTAEAFRTGLVRWGICRLLGVALGAALVAGGPTGARAAESFVTVFGGVASSGSVGETTVFRAGTFDSYLLGLGLARTVVRHGEWARWEAEAQGVKHLGMQTHAEANGVLILRWLAFPWNAFVPTTLAAGDGLSYATRKPEVEIRRQGRSTRLLNYLLYEVTVSLPGEERWSLSLRQHHRSGIFGFHNGMHGGSDFWVVGVRRAL